MKAAIISDIHGNLQALQRVIEHIDSRGITEIYCLGDIVGYGANPNECLAVVKDRCNTIIAGNHDWAVVGKSDILNFKNDAKKAIEWTSLRLSFEDRKFLAELTLMELKGDCTLVHATPKEPQMWHYLRYSSMLPGQFEALDNDICFIGHSHSPLIWDDGNEKKIPKANEENAFDFEKKYIINVGSVGQPRDGDSRACYVMYDSEARTIEHVRLEYDVEKAADSIINSDLPGSLASRLYHGK